jgi:crotonobetainyl-CoA:carnitine CoA-transferase CaiB-like acyl-CoA transferase
MSTHDADKPLAGIIVLDLTRLLPGPFATMQLADMGATVIKIEDKGAGDYARTMSHVRHELSQLFIAVNRGKRLLQLDLKDPIDHAQFLQMVETADVVIEGFRPGVMDRLGLGWETLKQINPRLAMCSISGYGQDGPLALQAGHDINYIATAGMLAQNCDATGRPVLPNLQIGDLLGGAQSAIQGLLAALLAAKLSGRGRFVDVAMTDAVFAHNIMPLLAVNLTGQSAAPARDFLTGGLPCYNVYRTSDERYMAVGALELKFWQICCDTLQRADLKDHHWSLGQVIGGADAMAVKAELDSLFAQRTLQEWTAVFTDADCCVTPILSTEEALHHPHFIARQMARQVAHPTEGAYWQTSCPVKFKD